MPPLYRLIEGKDTYHYIKDDAALAKFKAEHPNKKFEITRMKGLGELNIDETEETLINPESRIIKQITVEDIAKADDLFDQLMGTAIIPRKEYIQEHSEEATYSV